MGKIENFLWDKIYNGRYDADKCWNIALKNGYVKESDKRAFFKKHAELEKMYQERYGNIIPESKANKKMKKINENTLRKIVAESVKKVLKEDYDGNYLQLIKEEMHRLYDLAQKVPNHLQSEIYGMATSMQAMLEQAQRNDEFDNWNY